MAMAATYVMYLDVGLSLVCLPWILAHMVSGLPYADLVIGDGSGLPWPQRSLPVILAAPLLPAGLLCLLAPTASVMYVNAFVYIGPMFMVHLLATLLQTLSLLVAGSLITASIRDMSASVVI
jgi:hypothetical protein